MLLEKGGIQIELKNPVDIADHKKLGYKEVKLSKAEIEKRKKAAEKAGE